MRRRDHELRSGSEEDARERVEGVREDRDVVRVEVPGELRVEPARARPHAAERAIAARDPVPHRRVRREREALLEREPGAGHAHREHGRRRPQRLELEAVSQEVERVVALRGPELRVHELREDADHGDAGMQVKIGTHLARAPASFSLWKGAASPAGGGGDHRARTWTGRGSACL
jgi:hypothetical protein